MPHTPHLHYVNSQEIEVNDIKNRHNTNNVNVVYINDSTVTLKCPRDLYNGNGDIQVYKQHGVY